MKWLGGLSLSSLMLACSFTNGIDVCDRSMPAPTAVNQHLDGAQTLGSSRSMAVMPNGDALVLFNSTVDAVTEHGEVRGIRITSTGAPVDGCLTRDEREQKLFPVDLSDPLPQFATAAEIVPPPSSAGLSSTGLALLTDHVGSTPRQLFALTALPQGCFLDDGFSQSFAVSNAPDGRILIRSGVGPRALPLSPRHDVQRYVVLWSELSVVENTYRAMGRVLGIRNGIVDDDPYSGNTTPAPVELNLVGGPILIGLDAAITGSDEIRVIWGGAPGPSSYTLFGQLFDSDLHAKEAPQILATELSLGSLPEGDHILTAFDGEHFLVLWLQGVSDGTTRAFARSFLPDGRSAGDLVRLGEAERADDSRVSLTAVPGRGFIGLWRQQTGAPSTVGLRMVILDTYGRKVFNNQACKETDFDLFAATPGDVAQTALALTPEGRVLAAFTTAGSDLPGLSQSDIGSISLAPTDLYPDGTLRSVASTPGPVGPLPASYSGYAGCLSSLAGRPGRSCTCNHTCEPGGVCLPEETRGTAGGTCSFACDLGETSQCPAGSSCQPRPSAPTEGYCVLPCEQDDDCGIGRACYVDFHICMDMCTSDSDCATGLCDPYTKLCGGVLSIPEGAGLAEPCEDDSHCRSNYCTPSDDPLYPRACEVDCRIDVPGSCPELGVCLPLSGTYGVCLPPCVNGGQCTNPNLTCQQTRTLGTVCVAP